MQANKSTGWECTNYKHGDTFCSSSKEKKGLQVDERIGANKRKKNLALLLNL